MTFTQPPHPFLKEFFPHVARITRKDGGFLVDRYAGNFGYEDLWFPDLLNAIGHAELWVRALVKAC